MLFQRLVSLPDAWISFACTGQVGARLRKYRRLLGHPSVEAVKVAPLILHFATRLRSRVALSFGFGHLDLRWLKQSEYFLAY